MSLNKEDLSKMGIKFKQNKNNNAPTGLIYIGDDAITMQHPTKYNTTIKLNNVDNIKSKNTYCTTADLMRAFDDAGKDSTINNLVIEDRNAQLSYQINKHEDVMLENEEHKQLVFKCEVYDFLQNGIFPVKDAIGSPIKKARGFINYSLESILIDTKNKKFVAFNGLDLEVEFCRYMEVFHEQKLMIRKRDLEILLYLLKVTNSVYIDVYASDCSINNKCLEFVTKYFTFTTTNNNSDPFPDYNKINIEY